MKELPLKIEKLYKEIETLRDNLGKFIGGHETLNKIIKVQNPKDKSGHGLKGKKVVEKRVMKLISARTSLKKATHQRIHLVLTSTHMLIRKNDPKRFGYLRIK